MDETCLLLLSVDSVHLRVDPPKLFANLIADCHPISARSHQFSCQDRIFIEKETQRLLKEDIIEPSNSPWQTQVVVVKDSFRKWHMAIDYSETVNKSTLPDSYPLPCIDDTVNKIAQYHCLALLTLTVPIIRFLSGWKISFTLHLWLVVAYISLLASLLE